jgi:HTH-type transcriptional regulator, sugar sensing transcriptional regulator
METQTIANALQELGFHEVEAKIYLALLQNGKGTVSDIAKRSGLKRPTIYQYIDGLGSRDLIRKTFKGKRLLYYPEDPKKLLRVADNAKKRAEEVFPELQAMFSKSSAKPIVRFYEGRESIRSIYREFTSTPKTVWSVFAAERYFQVFTQKDGEEFLENIRKNGGELRDLVLHSPDGVAYVKQKWGGSIAKSKLLPKDFAFDVDIMVAGDKLAFISFENMIAVVIENKNIADLQMQFFRFLWKRI